ncbi:MAG TPA: vitamin K epoxide reductase family protein [Chloroflexota bacterium]|nr:vitamin K epoxide reductase family protein [Chloroflexota bacterium]
MEPALLSRQLRRGSGTLLQRRRWASGLSLFAAGSMGVIALYQLGIIKHLPDPPLPYFDSDKVDASEEAYAVFATPDAVLGLTNYGVTMVLGAMGGQNRALERPWIPLAWTLKALVDAAQAARLTRNQWTKHRAFCIWCLAAAAATFATVPLTLPEAKVAARHLMGSGGSGKPSVSPAA